MTAIRIKHVSFLAAVLASGTALVAQSTTGTLVGTIRDKKGAPIAGAKVMLKSAALMAPRILTTDDRGQWRAPLLPVGSYSISASKSGYIGSGAENVRVGMNSSATQDLTLRSIEAEGATVEVVAYNSTTIDKSETKVATNFSGDKMETLAVANRSFQDVALLTPGVTANGMGNGELSIGGASTNATLYKVNGIDVKNDVQGTRTGTQIVEDMIEDMQVVTSPLSARNGRTTGGGVNAVLKQGSNTFSGSLRAKISRPSWHGMKVGDRAIDNAQSHSDNLNKVYDITALGPVIKDRLWFAVAAQLRPSGRDNLTMNTFGSGVAIRPFQTGKTTMDGVTAAGPGNGFAVSGFDAGAPVLRMDNRDFYQGTMTLALNSNHTLEGVYTYEKQTLAPRDSGGIGSVSFEALGTQLTERNYYTVSYRGLLTPKLFVEARATANNNDIIWASAINSKFPEPIAWGPDKNTSSSRYFAGNNYLPDAKEKRGSTSSEINFKAYWDAMGQHDTDFGYQLYTSRNTAASQVGVSNRRFYVGAVYTNAARDDYRYGVIRYTGNQAYNGSAGDTVSLAPLQRRFMGKDGEVKVDNHALYLNDAWTVNNHLNLMMGVRYDWVKGTNTDGSEINTTSDFSPRMEVKWDIKGDAQHILTGSYALYREDINVGLASAFARTASSTSVDLAWTGVGINQPLPEAANDLVNGQQMYGVRFVDYAGLINDANWKNADGSYNVIRVTSSSAGWKVDPKLKAPYAHELRLSYIRAFEGGSRVTLGATYKKWGDAIGFSQDYRPQDWELVTDPLGSGKKIYVQRTYVFNSNELKREFKQVTAGVNHILNATWRMDGSLTYGILRGTDEGGDSATSTFRQTGAAATPYYLQQSWYNRFGYSANDVSPEGFLINHQLFRATLALTGNYAIGKGGNLSFGLTGSYDTGRRISYNQTSNLPTDPSLLGDPNLVKVGSSWTYNGAPVGPSVPTSFTRFYGSRGMYGYNDVFTVDFKIAYNIPLAGKVKLIGDIFVNNLFNNMRQDSYPMANYSVSGSTGAATVNGPMLQGIYANPYGQATPASYYIGQRYVAASLGLRF